jgi:hypothetical protein
VRDERRGHIGASGLLQPAPAGDAVELEHVVAPVRGPQHVDPRVVDAEDLRRLQAQALLVEAQLRGLRSSAAREVGAPPRADALDRRQHAAADDERAEVAAVVAQRLLQVVDGALELQRLEDAVGDVGVVHPRHPRSHRAEQRLDDDVAAELREGLERVVGALAGDGPRRGHARARQQRRGEELVDGALERARAVDAGHAAGLERVQGVHAEDDLLERPARDAPHDHGVAVVEPHVAAAHGDVAVDAPEHARHGQDAMLVPARRQRIGELLRVPAAARPQDRDGQPQNERSSTSRLTAPASKLRPLATLVSRICAGLNRSGSIL